MSRVTSAPILPPTVAAAHLESCAAELAGAEFAGMDDVQAIVPVLARAQRQLAVALNRLSDHAVGGQTTTAVVLGHTIEFTELSAVISAAGDAADATADALEEALPLLEDLDGDDTRS